MRVSTDLFRVYWTTDPGTMSHMDIGEGVGIACFTSENGPAFGFGCSYCIFRIYDSRAFAQWFCTNVVEPGSAQ